jgi:NifB/MoaA-like Fe-S oxidoreductase
MGKTAPHAATRLPIPITQARVQQAATALTAEIAATVTTVLLMLLYPQANTEAGKPARLVPISLLTPHIQAMAEQVIPARGIVTRLTILTAALAQPEILIVTKALQNLKPV